LLAGAVAIAVNTFLLAAADWIPLVTAHGGLLKLLKRYFASPLGWLGAAGLWVQSGLPGPGTHAFQLGFHVLVGLVMAVFYAVVLEPRVPGPPWAKGLAYAALVWLANAFIVLPWISEGIAGSRHLSTVGMAYFAAAHTVFFVLMAVLYARMAFGVPPSAPAQRL
jgi:hypothetical protein